MMAGNPRVPNRIPVPFSAVDVAMIAAWTAMLVGLIEGGYTTVLKVVFHSLTKMGPHIIWMAPLMDVVWFVVPALVLWLLARRWPAWFSLPRVASILNFLGFLCFFLLFDRLHRGAAVLLAGGLAVQTSRLIAAHLAGYLRLLRRTVLPLAGLIAASGLGIWGWTRLAERRALAEAPVPPAGAPNVLLLILDTVRSKSLSLDGYRRPTTPALERFATRGVHFRQAWSPSAWTLASHASMFTGYFPHQLSSGLRTPLDATDPTLAEVLTQRGYATGGFVANLHYCSREFGLDRGFVHYEDYVISPGEIFLNSSLGRYFATNPKVRRLVGYYDILGRKDAAALNRSLLGWLSGIGSRPFFAFVNYYDAHEPYLPPESFDRQFASRTPRKFFQTDQSIRGARRLFKEEMTPEEAQREQDAYEASIAYLDDQLGRLFEQLEARGLLENTIVIVTSDHGEQFGEHSLFVHGNSLYRPVMWVPLLMVGPSRLPAGATVAERVNLRDLPATVVDLLGVEDGPRFPGASLTRFLEPDSAGRLGTRDPLFFEVITVQKEILRSVVEGDLQYIRHQRGDEEIYDLTQASDGEPNLLQSVGEPTALHLRATLDSVLQATGPDVWGR